MLPDAEYEVNPGQPAADAANLGLIRPPFVYLGSIGLGLLLHSFWPVRQEARAPAGEARRPRGARRHPGRGRRLDLRSHPRLRQRLLPASISVPIGVMVVLGAGVLFASAVRTFRKAGTPVPGNRPTTTIVRAGPYRFSRNPIYLAFTLFQLGLAAWINSLGVMLTLFPALAIMALVVIPREERYLEARFPREYLQYRRTVHRWL